MTRCTLRGESIPKIGLGTSRLSGAECVTTVERALDLGYRFVDTARRYGNHAEVGEALERSPVDRDEVFLTTKIQRRNLRYNDVLAAAEDCLAELGVEYIDLLLIHWPSRLVPVEETLAAMTRLKADGTVRHVGVSNFTREGFADACDHADLLANEVLYNAYKDQDALREFCVETDRLLVAYSPLAKGLVTRNPVVREIAWRHQRPPAQVALRWLVQQANVVAIPKSTDPEHLRQNLAVFDFRLTGHEMERIAAVQGRPLIRLLHRLPSLVRSTPADTRGCQRKIDRHARVNYPTLTGSLVEGGACP
jgi:diketogulonate reductase-like aldo/keto reductase